MTETDFESAYLQEIRYADSQERRALEAERKLTALRTQVADLERQIAVVADAFDDGALPLMGKNYVTRDEWKDRAEAAEQKLATENRLLRASVPERWKDCDSPVGSVQSYIAELEGRLATARQALEFFAEPRRQHREVALEALDALNVESGAPADTTQTTQQEGTTE